MSDANNSSPWPRHKISDPHRLNDVLWSDSLQLLQDEGDSSLEVADNDNHNDNDKNLTTKKGSFNAREESVPWRSEDRMKPGYSNRNSNGNGNVSVDDLQGNWRFRDMLLSHCQEYETKTPMEKPLVSLKILNAWRNQTPPGRFLVLEPNTSPPLYKDMGDKKARTKISKALKQLVCLHNQTKSQQDHDPKLSHQQLQFEEEKKMPDMDYRVATISIVQKDEETSDSTRLSIVPSLKPPPKIPRFQKANQFERRISEQLHTAQADGRLFGRWKERDQLMAVFQHQRQQQLPSCQDDDNHKDDLPVPETATVPLVLISGSLGIGKTSLARTLRNPLVEEGTLQGHLDSDDEDSSKHDHAQNVMPFFLEGKFQHCQWEDPNAVFIAVMADFCNQLLKRTHLLAKYRQAIVQALPDDLRLLKNLVPSLAPILNSKNKPTHSSSGSSKSDETDVTGEGPVCPGDPNYGMAMQHAKQVFATFLGTIAAVSPDQNPVIVLLDDLHWASEPAIEVFQFIVTEIATLTSCGALFLATYLTDECDWSQEPHVTRALQQIKADHRTNVHDIVLGNLRDDSVNVMLSEALALAPAETRQVKDLIFPVTKGNPTFITELLRLFQERDIIRHDETTMTWTCDFERIPPTLRAIQSVADLFRAKIQALPQSVQETLRIAACLGSTLINESILKLIDTLGAVAAHLKLADMQGLLRYRDGHYYFANDSIKQAVMDLIPESDRAAYHLKIGQRMWLHLHENQNAAFYSHLVGQMMLSDHLVVEEEDRRSLAMFYLEAGQGAMVHLGFQTAWYCLSRGIKILKPLKKWGRGNYDLSLTLCNKAIEVCYCNGEFSQLDTLIDEVLQNARTLQDSLPARSTKIYSLGSRYRQVEAIKLGIDTLKELGQPFPSMKPSFFWVVLEFHRLRRLLRQLSDEDILKLPRMKDPNKAAALQIMNHLFLHTTMVSPALSALMVFRMVELTVKDGVTAMASLGIGAYGFIISSKFNDVKGGVRYGKLSLKLADRFKSSVWLNRTMMCYYGTIYPRRYPVEGTLEALRTVNRLALRFADVEYAVMSSCISCWQSAEILRLPVLESNVRQVLKQSDFYKQSLSFMMIKPLLQYILILMGLSSGDPKFLRGELVDDDFRKATAKNDSFYVMWYKFCGMRLAYIFSDFDLADSLSDTAFDIYTYNDHCGMDQAEALLYECLVLLVQVQRGKRGRFRTLRYVRSRLKKLKVWAENAPSNFLHKQYLLQAEIAVTVGDKQKARAHYRSAILHSRERSFYLEEALANEHLGKLYLKEGDFESAVPLIKEARHVYEKWGAKAKVEHFEREHGEVLNMSL